MMVSEGGIFVSRGLYFQGIRINCLFIEIFFDRLTGFAKVTPLFPTTSQGRRV
jgi:hypothetical protein